MDSEALKQLATAVYDSAGQGVSNKEHTSGKITFGHIFSHILSKKLGTPNKVDDAITNVITAMKDFNDPKASSEEKQKIGFLGDALPTLTLS